MSHKEIRDIQKEYDHLYATEPIRDEDRAYLFLARRVLKEQPNLRSVADIACGGAFFFRQFKAAAGKNLLLAGTDISSEALKLARKNYPEGKYALSAAEYLPFKENSFDALTCLGSFEHFLDLGQAAEQMRRVMIEGGKVFILVPNIFWYKDIVSVFLTGSRKVRNQTHERFASLGEWIELLNEIGLNVTKVEKYNGIAKKAFKQKIKDLVIPLRFSYHFLFICQPK